MREFISSINRSSGVLPSLRLNTKKPRKFQGRKTSYESTPQPLLKNHRKHYSEIGSPGAGTRTSTVRTAVESPKTSCSQRDHCFELFEEVIKGSPAHKHTLSQILTFYVKQVNELEQQAEDSDKHRLGLDSLRTENRGLISQIQQVQHQINALSDSSTNLAAGGNPRKQRVPPLSLQESTETFQEEFMSKAGEFSPSWREGIKLQKVQLTAE